MEVVAPARIEGSRLTLRLIEPRDASYVYSLRTDPAYNTYLSEVFGTVEDQKRWIEQYKRREAEAKEYYYIIERKDTSPCGVVRMYNIGPERFTWGSWILGSNKPPKAAVESAYCLYSIAFDRLALEYAEFDVRRENERTISFHRRFGASEISSDERNIYFIYRRQAFEADRNRFRMLIK